MLTMHGCGDGDSDPLSKVPASIPESSRQIEKVFAEAPERVRNVSVRLVEAYDAGRMEEAAGIILQMEKDPQLTFDQAMTIRNSRGTLESSLARGVEAGDPKAIAAFRTLQGSSASR